MYFDTIINYKPYENSPLIITLSAEEANKKFIEDLKDMEEFFNGFGLDKEKAYNATKKIWEKHLIKF